jgi:streptomycin 6-kinase
MISIPKNFARTTVELYAGRGAQWLERLPALVAECERRWSLTVHPPFEPLSYNYVAPATRADGAQVVLKLGVPNPELLSEMEALRFYDGRGIARLLQSDAGRGILLLERLAPGHMLSTLQDDERATSIAAGVMRQLWRPAPAEHSFVTLARWAAGLGRLRQRFDGGVGPLPLALVERAEKLFDELLGSQGQQVLLHGDLHHYNILSAQRQPWLALDPKGVVGEPEYEISAFLTNPWPQLLERPQPGRVMARRVDQFAEELGLERERLLAWGVAHSVLSAWWSIEDHGYGWEYAIACAELLAARL